MDNLEAKLKLSVLFAGTAYEGMDGFRHRFTVSPSELYPRAIEDILETIKDGRGYTNTQLDIHVQTVDPSVYTYALAEKKDLSESEISLRAIGLETARLWYTEKLHALIGHEPMALHINKDDRWRL